MKNKKIILTIGIPASGKSTWSKNFISKNQNYVRICRDDFRYMLRNVGWLDPKGEKAVTKMVKYAIESAINTGFNVVLDQTNVNLKYLDKTIDFCTQFADVHFQIFDVPLDTAIERDSKRDKSVGEDVIKKMYKNYLDLFDVNFDFSLRKKKVRMPSAHKMPTNGKTQAIIFDVDGTLAHNMGVRSYFDWQSVDKDTPDEIVKDILRSLKEMEFRIVIVTGRDGSCEDLTKKWFKDNHIHFDEFHIRPEGDMRKDSIIKKEIYYNNIEPNYDVVAVFDDRDQVVKVWRELGLKCFQVEYGNF